MALLLSDLKGQFIKRGAVFYFIDKGIHASDPHNFVILNNDPRGSEVVVLVCASSNVDRRLFLRRHEPPESVICIRKDEYPSIFTRDTVLDCNSALVRPLADMEERIRTKTLMKFKGTLPNELVEKLVAGVKISRIVDAETKTMLE